MKSKASALSIAITMILGASAMAAPVAVFTDPANDDYGPGTYTYPTESVFHKGCFDITGLALEDMGDKVGVTLELATPIQNAWDSPTGLGVALFHVYLDTEPDSDKGFKASVPGANLTFDKAWTKAIVAYGWGKGLEETAPDIVDGAMLPSVYFADDIKVSGRKAVISVPKRWLGTPTAKWGVQAASFSVEGWAPGAAGLGIRKVKQEQTGWNFGGAKTDDGFHTNAIDILCPAGMDQKALLSAYSAEGGVMAVIPLLKAE